MNTNIAENLSNFPKETAPFRVFFSIHSAKDENPFNSFQSWKLFQHDSEQIRDLYTFYDNIVLKAKDTLIYGVFRDVLFYSNIAGHLEGGCDSGEFFFLLTRFNV